MPRFLDLFKNTKDNSNSNNNESNNEKILDSSALQHETTTRDSTDIHQTTTSDNNQSLPVIKHDCKKQKIDDLSESDE